MDSTSRPNGSDQKVDGGAREKGLDHVVLHGDRLQNVLHEKEENHGAAGGLKPGRSQLPGKTVYHQTGTHIGKELNGLGELLGIENAQHIHPQNGRVVRVPVMGPVIGMEDIQIPELQIIGGPGQVGGDTVPVVGQCRTHGKDVQGQNGKKGAEKRPEYRFSEA